MNNNKLNNNKKNNKNNIIISNINKNEDEKNDTKNNEIKNIENNYNFIDKYTVTYTGDNNKIYIAMKENDKNPEDEKIIIQKNKNVQLSPKAKKKMDLKELFSNDKKMSLTNSSTPTVSSSPTSIITSNNNNSIISVSGKNGKSKTEWILTSCNEINLSFIKI